jgi:hypothetical protein
MLSRGLSSWGRLLGLARPQPVVEEERRLWGRIPCDLETTCRSVSGAVTGPLPARVQNIARGGIALVLGRAFEPGTLLAVSLPGGGSTTEVLACVVRCEEVPDSRWELGGTFAALLGDEDMQLFGACREQLVLPDQRGWERYPCQARATYQVVRSAGPSASQPAEVLNLSAGGIALHVAEPLEVGALLSLELSRDGTVVLTTLASVVRTVCDDNGGRVAGCNFIHELDEEQVKALQ